MKDKYLRKLRPFQLWALQNFPFIEADFDVLTNYEMMCKIVEYLNKVIDNSNSQNVKINELGQIVNELENYLENLDVQEEINNKLDEMAESGQLAEIINQEIFDELNEKIDNAMLKTDNQSYNNLTLNRTLRYFVKNTRHPEHVSGEDQPILQGGTYTGNDKMVIVKTNGDNNTRLQEISLIDGSVIRSANINLGHGNSVTFNPTTNKLYITGLTSDDKHKVFVINYTSFTLENTLIFDSLGENEGTHSISYDIVTDKYYLMTETLPTNYLKLYEININDYSLEEIVLSDYNNLLTTTNNNDMLVYDNIIYIMKFSPQVIITYNVESKKLQNVYNINNISSAKISIGELENISIMYDKDIKNILISSNRDECKHGFYNLYQFFIANPVYNVSNDIKLDYNNELTLYVDINSNSINPDGSVNNKFKHISEAIEYSQNIAGRIEINVSEGTYPYLYVTNIEKVLSIFGINATIQGAYINMSNNVYFTGFTFDNESTNQDEDLHVYRSYLKLSNCILSRQNNINFYLHNSVVNIFNITNAIFHSQAENEIICLDSTPTYKVKSGNIPTINKAVKLFNGNLSSTSQSTTYDLSDNNVLLNCNNLLINIHMNYSYISVIVPNITYDGTRIFACTVLNWLVSSVITRSGNTMALHISSSKNFAGNNVVDNTSSATGDFTVYALN